MKVSDQTIKNLEYKKVLKWISNYASSEIGKSIIMKIKPLPSLEQINKRYELIEQFIKLINKAGSCTFDGLINIAGMLKKAKIEGSYLSPAEILKLANQCSIYNNVKKYIHANKEFAPSLWKVASEIGDFSDFIKLVKRMISENGELYDIASEELLKVRKEEREIRQHLVNELEGFIRKKDNLGLLQEPLVLERDGRYVVLIKAERKKEVEAIIHGTSSSGAAYYCELLSTVNLNNQLKILKDQEKTICIEILRNYTNRIRGMTKSLLTSQSKVALLEFIHSLAKFSIEQNACLPKVKLEQGISIKEVYHPLLKYKADKYGKASVVALSIDLESYLKGLIITGPNMGGKTVALKNIGLIFLMAHSGLPVIGKKVSVPFIKALYADIGEKQDLIQDLSTFSSHIKNIVPMLNCNEKNALFIIDELGTGTDPSEGAPLAVAILQSLLTKEGIVIASTHHNAVKIFAETSDSIINASMDFDLDTLKPTFKIIPGIAGTSHAFEIAYKLGMSLDVIENAKLMRGKHEEAYYNALEKLNLQIKEFENIKEDWLKEKEAMETKLRNAILENSQQHKLLREERAKLIEDVKNFLRNAKNKIDDIVFEMKKNTLENALLIAKQNIKEIEKEAEVIVKREDLIELVGEKIKINDEVKLKGTSMKCKVVDLDEDEGYAVINYGNYNVQVPIGMLIKVDSAECAERLTDASSGEMHLSMQKKEEYDKPRTTLNLIGLRLDEAIEELKRFIDKAVLNNISQIKVVHGYGKIRNGVREYLKQSPFIRKWREADVIEGGSGSTIIEVIGIDE